LAKATEEQLNNPLHGVKLIQILEHLVDFYGWEEMGERIRINCFQNRPTIKSSLRFLRRTEWAREKVQDLYLESLESNVHPSVPEMWEKYIAENKEYEGQKVPESWHFCDNEKDAKEAAELVKKGTKQATSSSLWWFEQNNEPLPKIGDTYIITDWYKIAKAIIRTTKVEQVPFNQIKKEYTILEGEGDKSLEQWKQLHMDYYTQEMETYGEEPTEDMLIVCEQFETIWINPPKESSI